MERGESSSSAQRRVFCLVLDSLGVGELPDADRFGDVGAHTLDHLIAAAGVPDAPRLTAWGLGHVPGVEAWPKVAAPEGAFGRLNERSPGKDTSTGHWELMGCVLEREFPVYPDGFGDDILGPLMERCGLDGVLCNAPASGTEVIARLGPEHLRTGCPIVYTSADSVLQIAAHEVHFGLERLYEVCEVAREITRPLGIGRVIARPFVGEPGNFERTYNRRDYSLVPNGPTTLDRLGAAGVPVVGVGKIEDIFAGVGVPESVHTHGNDHGMQETLRLARELERGFVFVNLVDFDMLFGHRRDPAGYRGALERFDRDLALLERELRPDDVVLLTADHGNDPTHTENTDHTREYVPIVAGGPAVRAGVDLGTRATFADVGATVEALFDLPPAPVGTSFADELLAR